MTNNGVVLIANNNGNLDYVKQAYFLTKRIQKYLDLPVSIITDSPNYLKTQFDSTIFDRVIEIDYYNTTNTRIYFDGALVHKSLMFKNHSRTQAYHLSPYKKTLVLDTDYIISNNILSNCFKSNSDLMLYRKSYDISQIRDEREFKFISDKGIDFYWATVIYFEKNEKNDVFFNLIDHIEENWDHYRRLYAINSILFRNDFAFSIAIHMMSGFEKNQNIVTELPGKHYYTTDKDLLWKLDDNYMLFLVEKKNYLGEYTAISIKNLNVHVMNKFSLERVINEQ